MPIISTNSLLRTKMDLLLTYRMTWRMGYSRKNLNRRGGNKDMKFQGVLKKEHFFKKFHWQLKKKLNFQGSNSYGISMSLDF